MAARKSGGTALWLAGSGWGLALGLALGVFVVAPHIPGGHVSESASSAGSPSTVVGAESEETQASESGTQDSHSAKAISKAQKAAAEEAEKLNAAQSLPGALEQQAVLVISTADAAEEDIKDVQKKIAEAGAVDAGWIGLKEDFLSTAKADQMRGILTHMLPAGAMLSEDSLDAGTHAGEAMGFALLLDAESNEQQTSSVERGALLQTLRDNGFLSYQDGTILPAHVIIVVTGNNDGSGSGAYAAETLANFVIGLSTQGRGAVLAGQISAAAEDGPIGLIRKQAPKAVSTVDSVDQDFARLASVLAAAELLKGSTGNYGATTEANGPVPEF